MAATAVVAAAVRGGEEKVSEMTKEVQELFRADTGESGLQCESGQYKPTFAQNFTPSILRFVLGWRPHSHLSAPKGGGAAYSTLKTSIPLQLQNTVIAVAH